MVTRGVHYLKINNWFTVKLLPGGEAITDINEYIGCW